MSTTISYNLNNRLNVQTGQHKTYFPIRGKRLTEEEAKTDHHYFDDDGSDFVYETKSWRFKYPYQFLAPSENDKYIIFQYCRATVNGSIDGETTVHASFIPRDQYCDNLVYLANLQVPDDNRKYLMNTNTSETFEVWFRDGNGNKIVPDSFVMFLKLEY